jgi:ABC-type multidrug transport system ATPase subunit/GNAT superfamily N-acetyltransferase
MISNLRRLSRATSNPVSKTGVPKILRVVRRSRARNVTKLKLDDTTELSVRPFVPVGQGDRLIIDGEAISVVLPKLQGVIPLTPAWSCRTTVVVGNASYTVTIKEIETPEEMDGFERLTERHYRGAGGAGRTVPLIATIDAWDLPPVVGFIELASSFIVNTARKRVFDLGFSEPDRGVAWARWDRRTAKRCTNLVGRISRCVVHPELRGLGISSMLVDACASFAYDRWHYGSTRPLFVEITADMLRFFPFVKKSGFVYVGDTEGNEHRLPKDMKYLLGRSVGKQRNMGLPKGGGGILSLQRSYAMTLAGVLRQKRTTVERLLNTLKMAPEKLSDNEWILLHKVFRRPKPTYMLGLTPRAKQLLSKAIAKYKRAAAPSDIGISMPLVDIGDLNLSILTKPTSSTRSRKVQEAFGIVGKEIEVSLIRSLDLQIRRGEIVLVTGPSGTGKSLLLRAVRNLAGKGRTETLPPTVALKGKAQSGPVKIASLRDANSDLSPIDLLGEETIENALRLMATAGLAEPQLFVRSACQLSEGQRYRMSLAMALAQRPDLLVMDAFCEPLDRFSAAAVCKRLRTLTRETGLAILAATADPERLTSAMQPDRVLVLSSTGDAFWGQPENADGGRGANENAKGNNLRTSKDC